MTAVLTLLLLSAPEYDGKYKADPRFRLVRAGVAGACQRALARIGQVLKMDPPGPFELRYVDSGRDRSGLWAEVKTEARRGGKPQQVLWLRTEHLVLGSHDLQKTLAHEFFHCLQRERLGEEDYRRLPVWAREGAAVYIAGQLEKRAAALAAHLGSDRRIEDPLARLVDGLGGRHALEDYAEDACAFEAVELRHGRKKLAALLRRLLESPDVERAIREVLGEDFETFERAAMEHARKILAPLVKKGRAGILAATGKLEEGDPAAALDLLAPEGAYVPVAVYHRALALHRLGRNQEALECLRSDFLRRRWRWSTLLSDALLLELRLLRALEHPEFERAAANARLDLEPF
ncbi:MAG: hypothetical protein ACYSX0_16360, partial [Planctomycetota bacterium]